MSKGYWRNWEETNCPKCGQRIYKKDLKKHIKICGGKNTKEKKKAILIKKLKDWPDKVIYRGTLKGCKQRIKPSQKDMFEIRLIN